VPPREKKPIKRSQTLRAKDDVEDLGAFVEDFGLDMSTASVESEFLTLTGSSVSCVRSDHFGRSNETLDRAGTTKDILNTGPKNNNDHVMM
jgi:hypothetical protein